MSDLNNEFNNLFKNGCGPVTDWNTPRYFDSLNNPCYEAEAALMSSLTSEAYREIWNRSRIFYKGYRY